MPEPACDLWKVLIRLIPPHERQDVDKCSSEKEILHLNRKKNTHMYLCMASPHFPCGLNDKSHAIQKIDNLSLPVLQQNSKSLMCNIWRFEEETAKGYI